MRAEWGAVLTSASEEDPRNGRDQLDKLSQPVQNHGRSYSRFNLFDSDDEALVIVIARGEFDISGMQNKILRRFLPGQDSGQGSRRLKRFPVCGLIKQVTHSYRYYLSQFGQSGKTVITTGPRLRDLVVIPQRTIGPAV